MENSPNSLNAASPIETFTPRCGLALPAAAEGPAAQAAAVDGTSVFLYATAAVWLILGAFVMRLRRKKSGRGKPEKTAALGELVAANGEVRRGSDALAADVGGGIDSRG
jgi:hypothetical protein